VCSSSKWKNLWPLFFWVFGGSSISILHMRIQFESSIINFKTLAASAKRRVQASWVPVKKQLMVFSGNFHVLRNPGKSTHQARHELHISQSALWKILSKCLSLWPHKLKTVKKLYSKWQSDTFLILLWHDGRSWRSLNLPKTLFSLSHHVNSCTLSDHHWSSVTFPTYYKSLL
jgi:hypothetical protein